MASEPHTIVVPAGHAAYIYPVPKDDEPADV